MPVANFRLLAQFCRPGTSLEADDRHSRVVRRGSYAA
jgi:hypothetical protein